ncbi:hypothetical protein [Brevundimonas sp.]|uniref:hypothetical protein n=1 Tax=Brevundimonas sp. TaxID=1871086 RepID=UPI002D60D3A2|nr:hypothetical protein [Brevundimonas sp.]HYC66585.1 hypothetical protein [Brevundimonas sp.]
MFIVGQRLPDTFDILWSRGDRVPWNSRPISPELVYALNDKPCIHHASDPAFGEDVQYRAQQFTLWLIGALTNADTSEHPVRRALITDELRNA